MDFAVTSTGLILSINKQVHHFVSSLYLREKLLNQFFFFFDHNEPYVLFGVYK